MDGDRELSLEELATAARDINALLVEVQLRRLVLARRRAR